MIIDLLPELLHMSSALFFSGLPILSLGVTVVWLVSITRVMAYVVALIIPLIHPYCLHKVPLTIQVHPLYHFLNGSLVLRSRLLTSFTDSSASTKRTPSQTGQRYQERRGLHSFVLKITPVERCRTRSRSENRRQSRRASGLHSSTSNAPVSCVFEHRSAILSRTTP